MAKVEKSSSSKTPKAYKMIYAFGKHTDGNAKLKALLGGKGANLAEMASIGLPVPPGFTLTTEVCTYFNTHNNQFPKSLNKELKQAIASVEKQQEKSFGDANNPLLLSVRSGSRESMPGMMDTILNLGLNDKTVEGLAKATKNERFAFDCYRRFIHMYSRVVLGVHAASEEEADPFEALLHELKEKGKVQDDVQLDAKALQKLIKRYQQLVLKTTKNPFPQEVHKQLEGAIKAVFRSWNNERAILYRQKYNIPSEWGTAVNVQAMVFGNRGDTSATGVAFTRNPANGTKEFYGEYLINAQGEDVVAGTRTPHAIAQMEKEMPKSYFELEKVRQALEKHFCEMQDFEFTIEEGKLYVLQTRNGKRTGLAAVRIAVDLVKEKLITKKWAIQRIPADSISSFLVPIFDEKERKKVKAIAYGLPAGPGAASGKIVFTSTKAESMVKKGEKVLLCRIETSPEDLRGMLAAEGILTCRGGVSSHAALVARQMGKVCVCGASAIHIDYKTKTLSVGKKVLKEGDLLSIDGSTGEVFSSALPTAPSEISQVLDGKLKAKDSLSYSLFEKVMSWADEERKLKIRVNADTPEQAETALKLGAEGIGLCRTEHMFFEGKRIDSMREMILAETSGQRIKALDKLLPFQKSDFVGIFKTMKGRPVTIRLIDPPLHEFLPQDEDSVLALAKVLKISVNEIKKRIHELHESNPMLGHRGCRLGIAYPEITRMQAKAIFEAAAEVLKKHKIKVQPEVMIPLIGYLSEFEHQANCIREEAEEVQKKQGVKIDFTIGTMIEIPRAALCAEAIAQKADFFSFGTNDLTQTTLGMSRDDMGKFFPIYTELEIIPNNPFGSIDQEGVGKLVEIAVKNARKGKKSIKLGVCGEHGGDPKSIEFFHKVGLNYVSCSPNRVPIARLAAAQAALKE